MALLAPTLTLLLPGLSARADELGAGESVRGIVVHDADETLRTRCSRDADGTLWFALPGGPRWALIESVADPAITNRGDGAFHAFDAAEIQAALAGLRYPVRGVSADVWLLPYPRRDQLESAAGPGVILLSPGVGPLSRAHQQATFVHELGHVVQYALLPDGDLRWARYRTLRGIVDASRFSASAVHADRPHEIFAEDFRALFGGADANESGTIENATITPPDAVSGLAGFMAELAGVSPTLSLAAWPNPARGAVSFRLSWAPAGPAPALDLFDAAGRRVATLAPHAAGLGVEWSCDGRDAAGHMLTAGVLYARPRGVNLAPVRVVLAP